MGASTSTARRGAATGGSREKGRGRGTVTAASSSSSGQPSDRHDDVDDEQLKMHQPHSSFHGHVVCLGHCFSLFFSSVPSEFLFCLFPRLVFGLTLFPAFLVLPFCLLPSFLYSFVSPFLALFACMLASFSSWVPFFPSVSYIVLFLCLLLSLFVVGCWLLLCAFPAGSSGRFQSDRAANKQCHHQLLFFSCNIIVIVIIFFFCVCWSVSSFHADCRDIKLWWSDFATSAARQRREEEEEAVAPSPQSLPSLVGSSSSSFHASTLSSSSFSSSSLSSSSVSSISHLHSSSSPSSCLWCSVCVPPSAWSSPVEPTHSVHSYVKGGQEMKGRYQTLFYTLLVLLSPCNVRFVLPFVSAPSSLFPLFPSLVLLLSLLLSLVVSLSFSHPPSLLLSLSSFLFSFLTPLPALSSFLLSASLISPLLFLSSLCFLCSRLSIYLCLFSSVPHSSICLLVPFRCPPLHLCLPFSSSSPLSLSVSLPFVGAVFFHLPLPPRALPSPRLFWFLLFFFSLILPSIYLSLFLPSSFTFLLALSSSYFPLLPSDFKFWGKTLNFFPFVSCVLFSFHPFFSSSLSSSLLRCCVLPLSVASCPVFLSSHLSRAAVAWSCGKRKDLPHAVCLFLVYHRHRHHHRQRCGRMGWRMRGSTQFLCLLLSLSPPISLLPWVIGPVGSGKTCVMRFVEAKPGLIGRQSERERKEKIKDRAG